MLFAGLDLGSTTAKVAVVECAATPEPPSTTLDATGFVATAPSTDAAGDDGLGGARLLYANVRPSGFAPDELADALLADAASAVGLSGRDGFDGLCATGYGRQNVNSISRNISEISAHARACSWAAPDARTLVDIGGQDVKVVALSFGGRVVDFCMNDKCAAGTGRFFEAMARILQCELDELSALAMGAKEACRITSTCSVFAESEVVALINSQIPRGNIARGIFDSIAERVFGMTQRVGLQAPAVLTGGCAKSRALHRALEERLEVPFLALPCDPQVMGAVGAALHAADKELRR